MQRLSRGCPLTSWPPAMLIRHHLGWRPPASCRLGGTLRGRGPARGCAAGRGCSSAGLVLWACVWLMPGLGCGSPGAVAGDRSPAGLGWNGAATVAPNGKCAVSSPRRGVGPWLLRLLWADDAVELPQETCHRLQNLGHRCVGGGREVTGCICIGGGVVAGESCRVGGRLCVGRRVVAGVAVVVGRLLASLHQA